VTLIKKYLDHYAENEVRGLQDNLSLFDKPYRQCIVIPAYNEDDTFLKRIIQTEGSQGVLLILVINQPQDTEPSQQNIALVRQLSRLAQSRGSLGNAELYRSSSCDVLLVDRFNPALQIPQKQGVGLARKIGCDLATALHDNNILHSSWIYSTDADVQLPNNYFLPLTQDSVTNKQTHSVSCRVFDFSHVSEKTQAQATQDVEIQTATDSYEAALKYYQQGLAWAGSPYSFYTLGSTLAIDIASYCKVRGFPKRAGGEDFYLLNKLAKVGKVMFDDSICILIQARISDRVPFGTGPAVKAIIENNRQGIPYHYYNANIFIQLAQWLLWATEVLPNKAVGKDRDTNVSISSLHHCDEGLNHHIIETMLDMGFDEFYLHARAHSQSADTFRRHFHNWFDGFRTLKFIHYMQNNVFPARVLDDSLVIARQFSDPTTLATLSHINDVYQTTGHIHDISS